MNEIWMSGQCMGVEGDMSTLVVSTENSFSWIRTPDQKVAVMQLMDANRR